MPWTLFFVLNLVVYLLAYLFIRKIFYKRLFDSVEIFNSKIHKNQDTEKSIPYLETEDGQKILVLSDIEWSRLKWLNRIFVLSTSLGFLYLIIGSMPILYAINSIFIGLFALKFGGIFSAIMLILFEQELLFEKAKKDHNNLINLKLPLLREKKWEAEMKKKQKEIDNLKQKIDSLKETTQIRNKEEYMSNYKTAESHNKMINYKF